MYFSHAFKKVFPVAVTGDELVLASTGTTATLTPGQLGLFDAKTYAAVTAAPGSGNQTFILAMGSYHTVDKIGPFHGGYKESVKSKVINPKYISRFIKVEAQTAQNQIKQFCVCNLLCDTTYNLRLDIKGSPALRFLTRNLYKTLSAYTGCCTDPTDPTIVDPTIATIEWAKQIQEDPFLSQYITVVVKDTTGAVVTDFDEFEPIDDAAADDESCIVINVAYIDTAFGDCTFTYSDHYELEPLFVYGSLVDESGDPCLVQCFEETEIQTGRQKSGTGELLLREYILSQRYLQDYFHDGTHIDSFRKRSVEDDTALTAVSRTSLYDHYLILHNVPRWNNPTSVFDNDQYLLDIAVPTGTDADDFEDLIQDFLDLAGQGVVLETFSAATGVGITTTSTSSTSTTSTTTTP